MQNTTTKILYVINLYIKHTIFLTHNTLSQTDTLSLTHTHGSAQEYNGDNN